MDLRLIDAAREGDIEAMYVLLRENPCILDNVDRFSFIDTPLHVAVSASKISFAMEIVNMKPSFTKKLNQDGYSPMHLASLKGDLRMVKELMTIGHELCLLKGRERRTPLHCAAMSGNIDIINELVLGFPKSIVELTVQKETALHLALKNNQLEAFQLLLDWVKEFDKKYIVNWKDNEGNTILHLAVSRENSQAKSYAPTIKKLLSIYDSSLAMRVFLWMRSCLAPKFLRFDIPQIKVNAKNANNQTALDILLQLPKNRNEDQEIQDILRRAKAMKSEDISIPISPPLTSHYIKNLRPLRGWMIEYAQEFCQMEVRNALLVVAVLTAAATFQTGVNPPGGVWQENSKDEQNSSDNNHDKPHKAGQAIMATHMWGLSIFTICNLSGFLISYAMIILLTHGFPLRSLLLLALHSMALTYMISLCIISPLDEESVYLVFPMIGLGLVIIFLLYMGALFLHYGKKKREPPE
ncbi:hypothetical protein HHK36_000889 [Tetracentron sinense]|uniref:PGG domain-containing protein n=1 Tax=Tetracentron sinense TaxID=13715 RepID=A0A834ZUY4_TETSI|nr:hypothetical protein HHK36_000889 [Tetracentron sinense]